MVESLLVCGSLPQKPTWRQREAWLYQDHSCNKTSCQEGGWCDEDWKDTQEGSAWGLKLGASVETKSQGREACRY